MLSRLWNTIREMIRQAASSAEEVERYRANARCASSWSTKNDGVTLPDHIVLIN